MRVMTLEAVRKLAAVSMATTLIASTTAIPAFAEDRNDFPTQTPIKHVVVIFQENVSFDHYFATYPHALNPDGGNLFHANPGTPTVNGLNHALLTSNPNSTQPFRLGRDQNYTCDQDHDYTAEQQAFDHGLMDKFPEFAGVGSPSCDFGKGTGLVMGYYDGNTTTALWNYAQHFAMSDNSFGTTFGPSTPGAVNLISGETSGVDAAHQIETPGHTLAGSVVGNTITGDPDPYYDDCGSPGQTSLKGKNVGDLLNGKGITWGWFEGGFTPTTPATATSKAVCGTKTNNLGGIAQTAYSAHHEPFQYYASTSNPHHLPPSSVAMIGKTDQANHQYDLSEFWKAATSGNLPAVSFLKANRAQDGHAGYSSPLDEQEFLVDTLNKLQSLSEWPETAVVIAYDDSDGWYDHVQSPILNQSQTSADALSNPGQCGTNPPVLGADQGRCGYGPRLPLLVISPYARKNFVDNTVTDQSSILRLIEDNWGLGRLGTDSFDRLAGSLYNMFDFKKLRNTQVYLDPSTGQVVNEQTE